MALMKALSLVPCSHFNSNRVRVINYQHSILRRVIRQALHTLAISLIRSPSHDCTSTYTIHPRVNLHAQTSASPPPRVSNVRRRLPPGFCRFCAAGYLITRGGDKMPLAMFPTCNCMTRSSGELGAQSESGRKSPSNFLASVTETYAFGAKNLASWFVPRIHDKENSVPSPEGKRRARLTDRSSSPFMYELDMYMYNPPLATKAEAQLAAKGRPNSPHSPTSII